MYIYKSENSEIIESLNNLYRRFQDEYTQNPSQGSVSVVSNTHIICNGNKNRKKVTANELFLMNHPDIKDIHIMVNLLPISAQFYILHYPAVHDVFVIEWNDSNQIQALP